MESSELTGEQLQTPGERLRNAREAAGISPREMADRLNWLPAHIQAVEENRFDSLRGAAFVRGYLRAYARTLGLDEDEMVALYGALEPEHAETPDDAGATTAAATPGQNAGRWVFGLVLFAVVAIALISGNRDKGTAEVADTAASAPEPAAEAVAEAVTGAVAEDAPLPAAAADSPVIESSLAVDAGAADSLPESLPEVTRGDSTVAALDSGLAAAEPEAIETPEPVAAASEPSDTGPQDAALEFSFSADCWLEVRDGDGQLIYADLRGAGDILRLDGTPPFEILAGDAAAVTLTYLGEPFPVRTRPGRDTARFTVGEP